MVHDKQLKLIKTGYPEKKLMAYLLGVLQK